MERPLLVSHNLSGLPGGMLPQAKPVGSGAGLVSEDFLADRQQGFPCPSELLRFWIESGLEFRHLHYNGRQ